MIKADSDFQVEYRSFQPKKVELKDETWEYGTSISKKQFKTGMTVLDVENICSLILEKIIDYNENNLKKQWKNNLNKFQVFHSDEFPFYIKIKEYIQRLINFINCDQHILILAMMNLDKFLELNTDFILTKSNCYK
jgi:hypothetical protein